MLVIREHSDPAQNLVVRWIKRWLPVTDRFHGEHFMVRAGSARSRKSAAPGLVILAVLGIGVMASLWTGPAIERDDLVEKDTSQREEPPAA
jgi:hypothetical protein